MSATSTDALCPVCAQQATRIPSHYQRTLADLPWAQVAVCIDLCVRRFFWDTPACTRQIFTERLPTVTKPWAPRTKRLAALQQQIGGVVGGSAGSRLCTKLACPAGVDLLLTLVRQRILPDQPTPRILGVDDWAFRKGQRYGTILIDHERGQIIELLPDRTPETLTQWLREHPGVEIVTRDRAEAYAQGITQGAPDAVQVDDRWHLIKNVTDALASVLQEHRAAIQLHLAHAPAPAPAPALALALAGLAPTSTELNEAKSANAAELSTTSKEDPMLEPPLHNTASPTVPTMLVTLSEQRRQERAQEVRDLHARGWSQKEIAQHLHCHPRTIRRDLRQACSLPAPRAARGSKLDRYKPYLLQRWNEGCHNASQLEREIAAEGFDGRHTLMRSFVAELRVRSGIPARSRRAEGKPLSTKEPKRVPASRVLAWLSTQPRYALEEEERAMLTKLEEVDPRIKTAMELGQAFANMVRQRQADQLEGWLERAMHCGIAALRSVATGLRGDLAAVRVALTLAWSNGRTEGSANRLNA